MGGINTLRIAHDFLSRKVPEGGFCIDATAGRGNDTAFLCSLVGEKGRVLAFDIQEEAVDSTKALAGGKRAVGAGNPGQSQQHGAICPAGDG